jgi:hypothetical protein
MITAYWALLPRSATTSRPLMSHDTTLLICEPTSDSLFRGGYSPAGVVVLNKAAEQKAAQLQKSRPGRKLGMSKKLARTGCSHQIHPNMWSIKSIIYVYICIYICLKFVSRKICEPIRLPWKRHCVSGPGAAELSSTRGYTNHSFEAFSFLPIPIPEHSYRLGTQGIHGVMRVMGRVLKTWKIWVWSDSVWNYRRILLCFF